ncbi:MAG TPA: ankyrin repeat domain-containing protein [Vicinamibacterales bacterium]|nr:ankyrin repeat domain-containing protein [Vicinamibacterales bacterium]
MITRRYAALGVVLGAVTLSAAGENLRLIDAVKQGNFTAAKALISQKTNVNAVEPDGMTALHWAVRADDLPTVQMLIRAGANVNATSRYGMTPIIFAAENGDPKVVAALLKAGANPNGALPEGQTALMTAARTGNVDTIKLLVETGAKVDTKEQWQGQTALMWAASQNNAAAVKALIDAGADKNEHSKLLSFPEFKWETSGMVVTVLPRGGWTPLMYAARDGAIDAVGALADAKADLNASDPDGTTALLYAITNAHFDTAAVLIEKGADPNVADSTGTTALYSAVDMHTMGPMLSRPSPKLVDKLDAADIVHLLIAKGANVNARLKRPIIGRHHTPTGDASLGEGTTPLARAAKSNDLQLMKALLDAGADPKLTLKDRTTVLTIAAAGGAVVGAYAVAIPVTEDSSIEAIKLCLDRGVDINAFNSQGTTAVHAAVQRGAEKVVRFLAEHGAKLDMKNKQGRTPLDIAMGVGATAGRGGGARGRGGAPRETMATLLRSLMASAATPGTPGGATPQ